MKQIKIAESITNRESPSLGRYLLEIGKLEILNAEEEILLAQQIRQGDHAALERLTRTNLRFVVSVAKKYQHQGMPLSDLINEGNLGLIKAALRFDETRGFKFISYAVWWIRQSILQALAEQGRVVRVPGSQVASLNEILKASARLEQQIGRSPAPEELAEAMMLETGRITATLANHQRPVSVDAPFAAEEEKSLLDVLASGEAGTDSALMADSLVIEVRRSLRILAGREREVLVLYFGLGGCPACSLEEIAARLELTTERVRQIREKALQRLRQHSGSGLLQSYL